MSNPVESTLNVYEAQFRAARDLASALYSSAQRIDRAWLEAAKETVNAQLEVAQAAAAVRDLQGVESLRNRVGHPTADKMMAFYREVFDAMAESVLASTQVFDRYLQDLAHNASFEFSTPSHAIDETTGAGSLAEFWNVGFGQWRNLAEQWQAAMAAGAMGAPSPDEKSKDARTRSISREAIARVQRH